MVLELSRPVSCAGVSRGTSCSIVPGAAGTALPYTYRVGGSGSQGQREVWREAMSVEHQGPAGVGKRNQAGLLNPAALSRRRAALLAKAPMGARAAMAGAFRVGAHHVAVAQLAALAAHLGAVGLVELAHAKRIVADLLAVEQHGGDAAEVSVMAGLA
jgi:hypothetical protein